MRQVRSTPNNATERRCVDRSNGYRSAVRRDGGSPSIGPRLQRVASTPTLFAPVLFDFGASRSSTGSMLRTSISIPQSGHTTISPSTASAANVIVASHSGQLAFTGQVSGNARVEPVERAAWVPVADTERA